jgi:hypothetical protein
LHLCRNSKLTNLRVIGVLRPEAVKFVVRRRAVKVNVGTGRTYANTPYLPLYKQMDTRVTFFCARVPLNEVKCSNFSQTIVGTVEEREDPKEWTKDDSLDCCYHS